MPNLKTITPLFLSTTAMLLIALTGCQDDAKRTGQTKTVDKPGQHVDEKAQRLENKAERLEDKAERLDLKAGQEHERAQEQEAEQQRTDTMGTKTDTKKMDDIDQDDEFGPGR